MYELITIFNQDNLLGMPGLKVEDYNQDQDSRIDYWCCVHCSGYLTWWWNAMFINNLKKDKLTTKTHWY